VLWSYVSLSASVVIIAVLSGCGLVLELSLLRSSNSLSQCLPENLFGSVTKCGFLSLIYLCLTLSYADIVQRGNEATDGVLESPLTSAYSIPIYL
jgi:hypothetical protein